MTHTHRYHRINIAREGKPPYWVMKCDLDNCKSYTPMKTKLSAPLLVGQHSICNKCGNRFELTRRALTLARPTCNECIVGPDKKKIVEQSKNAERFFQDLEKGLL